MGMTFLLDMVYLLPLTIFCLIVSVGALGFRASRRRGYAPFALGIVAGVLLLVGKFVVESDVAVYSSVGLLIAASFWNALPVRMKTSVSSSAPEETLYQLGSINKKE
jgi:mercuric ion transport protein